MKLLRHLPNLLTCCNLLCGCLGIASLHYNFLAPTVSLTAAYFVWGACFFDFLDGFAARALKVSSPIGKELDSLADMVSFGLLPTMFMFELIVGGVYGLQAVRWETGIFSFPLAIFSALRLAKFNIDQNQSDSFIGVPTPAVALFITGLMFIPPEILPFNLSWPNLVGITFVFSILMVAPFELFALKFKNFTWADNKIRFTFMLLAVLLLAWLQAGAVSLIILLYIAMSLVSRVLGSRK